MITISLNLLLASLLCGALWMGWRLNERLKVLREGQMGFAKAVADLDAAAARAPVRGWRSTPATPRPPMRTSSG